MSRCAKLIEVYTKRSAAVIATKGGSNELFGHDLVMIFVFCKSFLISWIISSPLQNVHKTQNEFVAVVLESILSNLLALSSVLK